MRSGGPSLRSGAVALCVALAGCYLPSAMQRSAGTVRKGWDVDRHGALVALTGPGGMLVAAGQLVVRSVLPGPADREPDAKWFHAYTGSMRPLGEVAVLCKNEDGLDLPEIRPVGGTFRKARHQDWHFPRCIEVLPGSYELHVRYYSRDSYQVGSSMTTETMESPVPIVVQWRAEAGAVYRIRFELGEIDPAPPAVPRPPRNYGAAVATLKLAKWGAGIEQLDSWDELGADLRGQREAWARFERAGG